jgi:hypothetical protein
MTKFIAGRIIGSFLRPGCLDYLTPETLFFCAVLTASTPMPGT